MPGEDGTSWRWGSLRGKRRGVLIGAGIAGALVAIAVVVLLALGPHRLAAKAIVTALEARGLAPVTVTVSRIGLGGIEISSLNAGAAETGGAVPLRLATARVAFAGGGPLGGIGRLELHGLRARLHWDDGAKLGKMPLGGGPSAPGKSGAPLLPFAVQLVDTEIVFDGPGVRVTATAPGEVAFDAGGGRGVFALDVAPTAGGIVAAHRGTLDLALDAKGQATAALALAPSATRGKALAGHVAVQARATADASALEATADVTEVSGPVTLASAKLAARRTPASPDLLFSIAAENATGAQGLVWTLASLGVKGRVVDGAERVSLVLDDCAEIKGIGVSTLVVDAPKLCPTKTGAALASLWKATGEASLDASLLSTRIALQTRDKRDTVAGQSPTISVAATSGAKGWHATFRAEGGDLSLQGRVIRLTDLLMSGELSGRAGALGDGYLDITNANIRDWTAAPLFLPLTFVGRGTVQGRAVGLILTANSATQGAVASATGSHDLESGEGRLDLALTPRTFRPDGLQPAQLLPFLTGLVGAASGDMTGTAAFVWTPKAVSSSADLALKNFGFRSSIAKLEGVDGRLTLASLTPPRTAKPQKVSVRMMDLGLPLPDGTMTYSLNADGTVRVSEAQFSFLDGTVGLSSAVFGARPTQEVTFAVSHVDLEKLLKLVDVKGLSGTGKISGQIPVRLTAKAQTIVGGRLSADAPGTLKYQGDTAAQASGSGGQTKLLFDALDDFRYDKLSATLDGDISGSLSLGVHLKGNNPKLYNGYPFELNVSTEGAFVEMVRNGLFAYRNHGTP